MALFAILANRRFRSPRNKDRSSNSNNNNNNNTSTAISCTVVSSLVLKVAARAIYRMAPGGQRIVLPNCKPCLPDAKVSPSQRRHRHFKLNAIEDDNNFNSSIDIHESKFYIKQLLSFDKATPRIVFACVCVCVCRRIFPTPFRKYIVKVTAWPWFFNH